MLKKLLIAALACIMILTTASCGDVGNKSATDDTNTGGISGSTVPGTTASGDTRPDASFGSGIIVRETYSKNQCGFPTSYYYYLLCFYKSYVMDVMKKEDDKWIINCFLCRQVCPYRFGKKVEG